MKLRVKFSLLAGLLVMGALGITGYQTVSFQDELAIGQAERQARMLSRQILLTRRWVADHEGLFVTKKPGPGGSPAPSASDVVDQSGQVYVKRNPGMIIWDLSDYAAQADFCRFRVTSLRPVNPANAPNDFERRGLLDFETGKEEVSEVGIGKQGRILRYMIPLKVEESCLPCHAEHGYQVGNIRGGLSLEVPLGWADEAIGANNRLLWLIGLGAVVLAGLLTFLLVNVQVVRRLRGLAASLAQFPGPSPEGAVATDDEIGELARGLTGLGQRLVKNQAELAAIREELCQYEKEATLGELAAGIALEVNAPLAGMHDSLKSLGDEPEQPEQRHRSLDTLEIGLLHIAHVVHQLQNRDREVVLQPVETDIDGLLRNCCALLAFALRDIQLQLELATAHPIRLDRGLLQAALVNIILNAVAVMPDGGELLVRSREEEDAVVISLRNSGPGIPPGKLARIAEPFSPARVEKAGCGLDLSLSYSLIKRLGGQMRVESRPGEGSLFTIELPRPSPGATSAA